MTKIRLLFIAILIMSMGTFAFAELEIALSQDSFSLANLPKYKRALAMDVSLLLGQEKGIELLGEKVSRNTSADLLPFLKELCANTREKENWYNSVVELDSKIREAKGIADRLDTILEIRLAFPEKGLPTGNNFLVSYIPGGNEKSWQNIEAFDTLGNAHQLDVHQAPEQQVVVVGLNAKKDMKAGIALMNEELRKAGFQPTINEREVLDVAKLDYVRLEDDMEPWISGDAEIYALVNGISPEASKPSILSMDMPYLDTDKKDYYPNQVLIVWQNYRFKAANINLYEHDDSTNYKEIVATLIGKIGEIVPEYKFIADIASQIIRLMPDSWFVNDDDYVDVYYTIEKGKTYTGYWGVSRNAKITLVPYSIPE